MTRALPKLQLPIGISLLMIRCPFETLILGMGCERGHRGDRGDRRGASEPLVIETASPQSGADFRGPQDTSSSAPLWGEPDPDGHTGPMAEQLWVIRAGQGARYVDDFLSGRIVGVGFSELAGDDLEALGDQALKARGTNPTDRIFARQLSAFAFGVDVDDLVIVPRLPKIRDYLVGRITSSYRHVVDAPPLGHHQRSVEWLGTFDREALSASAINTMGAIQTIFRPTAVEAELRSLITELKPVPAPGPAPPPPKPDRLSPEVVPKLTLKLPRAQLEVQLDELGRAQIGCGHPALVMEQVPRHVDPSGGWSGVPGIYVLTGTDLEQASVRTGPERTLTTTLIIRPWAYVGLSEDFLGRLGSHRQTKPEWRRSLLVRSGANPFSSDDIKYLEHKVHAVLLETGEVLLAQAVPRGNLSARPRNPDMLDACADTIVSVLRLTGTLI